jgi:DNA mismatch repair ATPase MutS
MRELKEKDSSVPNDLELRAGQLTVLNGPNTGGKSTILLTLCHSQILAQLGTRVVAESAELTVADQIIYQGSESSAGEEHGKFGKELKAFKTSLETASKKSLIILDEVGGGSAEDESRPIIRKTLIAFRDAKGCTIYVTHDRKLARELCQDGAKPLQIGFDQRTGRSTFKLIPGISARSHAEEAAEKVGLTDEFLAEFIKQK